MASQPNLLITPSRHYGYTFEWTDEHLSEEKCKPLRYSYDELADKALARLDKISPPAPSTSPQDTIPPPEPSEKEAQALHGATTGAAKSRPKRDLFALLRDNATADPVLSELWTQVTTVPDWVDWAQLARGQDVFYRYAGPNLTGLAYQSLLGGMGAARVVETLARTGGFSVKVAHKRLYETTQHILQVTRDIDSLRSPSGEGFASTVRVRLLHAAVRRRILTLAQTRLEYYSVEQHGVPINDLDCAATIATFSSTLIWLSLPRQGIFLRAQEIEDYVALWRYIAYLIGAPTEFFSTPSKARAVMQSIFLHEVHPTATSKLLAGNIIRCLADQPPGHPSAAFLTAGARWLNGPQLSDALGLEQQGWYYTFLMAGQCLFFAFFAYFYRLFPVGGEKRLAMIRKLCWSMVVESKYGLQGDLTSFEFKYVPEYGTITGMEIEAKKHDATKGGYSVESRNFTAALFGGLVLAAGVGVSYWSLRSLLVPLYGVYASSRPLW